MATFENYVDYIRLFVKAHDACKTTIKKPYRVIDFSGPVHTPGLSFVTANHNSNCHDSNICSFNETLRQPMCAKDGFYFKKFSSTSSIFLDK